ncbi:MAG: hypothetical protein Q9218_001520 [Villophora microphyllina]
MPATFIRRAISPVHFEPLQPYPDEILCPGSDAEETIEQHRDKRRRVEEAAAQYLRGKQLYIASARLKGPFTGHSRILSATGPTSEAPYVKERRRSDAWQPPSRYHQPAVARMHTHPTNTSNVTPEIISISSHESTLEHAEDAGPTNAENDRTQDSFVMAKSEAVKKTKRVDRARDNTLPTHEWLKTRDVCRGKRKLSNRVTSPTPTPSMRPEARSPKRRSGSNAPEETVQQEVNRQGFSTNETREQPRKRLKTANRPAEQEQHSQKDRPAQPTIFRRPLIPSSERNPARDGSNVHNQGLKSSMHALPSSTNLPAFEYRYAPRMIPKSPERRSFKEDLEEAKREARAEQRWRLSFTASDGIKSRSRQTSSRGSRTPRSSQSGSSFQVSRYKAEEAAPLEPKKPPAEPATPEHQATTSEQHEEYPEAQIRQEPAFAKVPSGPSTELLETYKLSSKLPSMDEGDSYIGLSTQGALLKAQRSFHNQIMSPVSERERTPASSGSEDHAEVHDERMLAGDRRTAGSPQPEPATPSSVSEEPMSTQAMIDGLSPFVDTTVKKRRSIDSRPDLTPSKSSGSSSPASPTVQDFRTKSFSMSTTSSPPPIASNNDHPIPLSALSKPASTLTSISLAPTGTTTEVFQYDGQQPQGYIMGDVDLNDAIEEAGSFLGDWSVEKEARNQERSTAESKASTAKSSRILSNH